jgi:hypothetical protein
MLRKEGQRNFGNFTLYALRTHRSIDAGDEAAVIPLNRSVQLVCILLTTSGTSQPARAATRFDSSLYTVGQ